MPEICVPPPPLGDRRGVGEVVLIARTAIPVDHGKDARPFVAKKEIVGTKRTPGQITALFAAGRRATDVRAAAVVAARASSLLLAVVVVIVSAAVAGGRTVSSSPCFREMVVWRLGSCVRVCSGGRGANRRVQLPLVSNNGRRCLG
jgi:hypothetical protein